MSHQDHGHIRSSATCDGLETLYRKVPRQTFKVAWTHATTFPNAKAYRTILRTAHALSQTTPQPKHRTAISFLAQRTIYPAPEPTLRNTWTPRAQFTKYSVTTASHKAPTSRRRQAMTTWTAPTLVPTCLHVLLSAIPTAYAHSSKASAIRRQALAAVAPIPSSCWPSAW